MEDNAVLIHTGIAVVGAILLIVWARVNPAISLAVGAIYLGLTSGLGFEDTVAAMTTGFGDILAEVGALIAFGVLTGSLLHRSGGIDRLVVSLLRVFGARRMPYATSLTTGTFLQTIFTDVQVVLSAPILRRVATQVGDNGLPRVVSALAIGSVTGVVLVVPGAAGVAIAGVLGVPLGKMLVTGLVLGVPTIIISTWIMNSLFKHGWWDPAKDEQAETLAELDEEPVAAPGTTGPGTSQREASLAVLFAPLIVSLLLIAAGGLLDIFDWDVPVLGFLGTPMIALLIGLIGTTAIVRMVRGRDVVEHAFERGFMDSGQILVLTGVAGSLAGTIQAAGLGDIIGEYLTASSTAPLLVVWAMAAVIHVAIGTVTIAAIMSVGVLAPVAAALGIDPVLIALAAGSGSIFGCHVTSNTFWQFQALFGQSVRGTFKTFTVGISVASVVSILLLLPLSLAF